MTLPDWRIRPEPREWQRTALEKWRAEMRGVVSVVTGGGKTVFAEMCMSEAIKHEPRLRFIVVVPTLALVDQWAVSLQDDLGVEAADIAIFAEGRTPPPARVNLMTMVAARVHAPALARQGPTMAVVDECHRIASTENGRALAAPFEAALGLSATPEREHDQRFEEVVVPALGEIIFRYTYVEALADRVVSPFTLVNIRVTMAADEQEAYDELTKKIGRTSGRVRRGELPEAALARLLQRRARVGVNARMRVPVAVQYVLGRPPERTLIFHESIPAAEQIRTLLGARGRRVSVYHSKVGSALRLDNLRMYRKGIVDTLVTCRALDEGINVPQTVLGVVASGTGSSRQRIQRLGRVLRPAPGKSSATLVTLYATDVEERRLAEEAISNPGAAEVVWAEGRRP